MNAIAGSMTQVFLDSTASYPIISLREERTLHPLLQPHVGQREVPPEVAAARRRLVEGNLRLAFRLALKWSARYRIQLDDAISSALHGLIEATPGFNPARGYRFATYAGYSVMARIQRDLPDGRPDIYRRRRRNGRPAILLMDDMPRRGAGDGMNNVPARPDEAPAPEDAEARGIVAAAVASLPDREREVLTRRFGLAGPPERLDDIAPDLGVSKERVRQIQNHAQKLVRRLLGPALGIDPPAPRPLPGPRRRFRHRAPAPATHPATSSTPAAAR